jgi:hypothetical protein
VEIVIQVNGTPDMSAVIGGELSFYNPDADEYEMRDRTLGDLVAEKLAEKIFAESSREQHASMREKVTGERSRMIREKLEPILTAAMQGEIFETNSYGERVSGAPITLTELIVKEARKAMAPRTGYNQKPTVLEKVVDDAVGAALTKELNEAIGAAKAEMVKAVRAKAAEFLAAEVLERKTR